jgi:GGDEF domain-containing protein
VGVLALYSGTRNAFTEDHRRIVEVVSRQVSKTIANALALDRQSAASLGRSLSKAPNLEVLRQFVNSEIVDRREPIPLSLVLIEIQSPRSGEDSKANAAIEQTIGHLIESTRRNLRGADLLFKLESHEVVALLPQTDSTTAHAVVQKIGSTLSSHSPSGVAVDFVGISAAVGIASGPTDGTSLDALIRVARSRLRTLGGFSQHRSSIH